MRVSAGQSAFLTCIFYDKFILVLVILYYLLRYISSIGSCCYLKLLLQQLILYIKTNTNFFLFNNFIPHFYSNHFNILFKTMSDNMSIFNNLGWRFRRIHYHELERMFGWLFLLAFSLRRFCHNSWYHNSDIHRRIIRLHLIYNFVECFFRVKSILWDGSLLLVSRVRHIMDNVNFFGMCFQLFQSLGSKGTLLAMQRVL